MPEQEFRVCEGCEFSGDQVAATPRAPSAIKITEDGGILNAEISQCGASMSKVGADEVASDYPGLLERIVECVGPIEVTESVPRRWPLGFFGATKEVEVRRCGATDETELQAVVRTSRAKARTGIM